jgi:hypothetical protein
MVLEARNDAKSVCQTLLFKKLNFPKIVDLREVQDFFNYFKPFRLWKKMTGTFKVPIILIF